MNVKELMVHVERIVRPVRADASKLRMRRELLAHLQAAYEEELRRNPDESAALEAAKRRLGHPAELTRELQASVSRLERLSVTPFPRWAWVIPAVVAFLLSIVIAIVPTPAWMTASHVERTFTGVSESISRQARLAFAGSMVAMEVYIFVSVFCIMRGIGIAKCIAPRGWWWIAAYGLLVLATQLLWTALFCVALTGHLDGGAAGYRADLIKGGFVVTGFVVGFSIIMSVIRLPGREWHSLDIGEGPRAVVE